MGNVYASSQKPTPGDVIFADPQEKSDPLADLENPGSMEDLHKKCKEIFPVNFEGAKIVVQKGLSNHFQVSHSLNLSSLTPSGYRFGASYVGTHQFGPSESFPVLLGDIDPSGNLNANLYHKFNEAVMTKFHAQVLNNKCAGLHCVVDYRTKHSTTSLTVANPDVISNSGVLVCHYLQSVTKHVDLGAEVAYQKNHQLPGSQAAITTLSARYTGEDYTVSGSLGLAGLHVCYYQKASQQLQLGVELETNFRMRESVASIGYQIDIPKADLVYKGMVDSNWNVAATLEKRLTPLPFTLTLSGMLNHIKNQFRLGVGFMIG